MSTSSSTWSSTSLSALFQRAAGEVLDRFFWLFGVFLLAFAAVLIGFCVWVYYYFTLPYLFPSLSVGLVLNFAVSVWLLSNLVFNYVTAVTTSAGEPPKAPVPNAAEAPFKAPSGTTICRKCRAIRPPRAHHCSICKRCYHGFDHHCPWMHNCVGHNNRRYFVLTLVYLWLGCVYYSLFTLTPFYQIHFLGRLDLGNVAGNPSIITFVFVMAAAMILAVGALMFWHIYLVCTAQTSIEFYLNHYSAEDMRMEGQVFVNEYDLGIRWNLIYFFNIGERYPWWLILLPVRVPPIGDGSTFITVRDHIDYTKSMQGLATANVNKIV